MIAMTFHARTVLQGEACTTLWSMIYQVMLTSGVNCNATVPQGHVVVSQKLNRTPAMLPTSINIAVPIVTEMADPPFPRSLGLGAGELLCAPPPPVVVGTALSPPPPYGHPTKLVSG